MASRGCRRRDAAAARLPGTRAPAAGRAGRARGPAGDGPARRACVPATRVGRAQRAEPHLSRRAHRVSRRALRRSANSGPGAARGRGGQRQFAPGRQRRAGAGRQAPPLRLPTTKNESRHQQGETTCPDDRYADQRRGIHRRAAALSARLGHPPAFPGRDRPRAGDGGPRLGDARLGRAMPCRRRVGDTRDI